MAMNFWRVRLLAAGLLAGGFVTSVVAQTPKPPAPPAQDAMSKELAALQGRWQVVSMNGDSPADQGAEIVFVMKDKTYQVIINGTVDESGTFDIDTAKKPVWYDLSILEGNDAGKHQPGVIEIGTDTLKIALSAPGETSRPTDVTNGAVTVVLKKQK